MRNIQTHSKSESQQGQTLIETILATFMLSTALVTGLALAVYALSASATAQNQLIATNLAREGIEVVRMMRDTNWLEGDVNGGASFNLDLDCGSNPPNGQNGAGENPMDGKACYPSWLNGPSGGSYHNYNITGSNNNDDHRLIFDPSALSWSLDRRNGSERFHLCIQADGTYQHNSTCDSTSTPLFARRVRITDNSTASPYTPNHPKLSVQSAVIWSGKNCPDIVNQNPITYVTPCKVLVEEQITNWKDYK